MGECSLVLLGHQTAVRSHRVISFLHPGIQPQHVSPDPYPPCGCQKPPVPVACCSSPVNLVITQMLSEAMSEHSAKTASPEGTFGQSGLSECQNLRHLFDRTHLKVGLLSLELNSVWLAQYPGLVLVFWSCKSPCNQQLPQQACICFPPRSSSYFYNYPGKHLFWGLGGSYAIFSMIQRIC